MKQIYQSIFYCCICLSLNAQHVVAQSIKAEATKGKSCSIVNTSQSNIHYVLFASDGGSCDKKYKISGSVAGNSTVTYRYTDKLMWQSGIPKGDYRFTELTATFTDAAGSCNTAATNAIGEEGCAESAMAKINTRKCSAGGGKDINLSWTVTNGNVVIGMK